MTARKTTRPNHMTPDERDLCIALYRAGATLDDLAFVFSRARNTIRLLTKRRNV